MPKLTLELSHSTTSRLRRVALKIGAAPSLVADEILSQMLLQALSDKELLDGMRTNLNDRKTTALIKQKMNDDTEDFSDFKYTERQVALPEPVECFACKYRGEADPIIEEGKIHWLFESADGQSRACTRCYDRIEETRRRGDNGDWMIEFGIMPEDPYRDSDDL
jgi:hypothetical protein